MKFQSKNNKIKQKQLYDLKKYNNTKYKNNNIMLINMVI